MQLASQVVDELQNAAGFGFDNRLHYQLALLLRTAITTASWCTSMPSVRDF
jgi:hypothetical protein